MSFQPIHAAGVRVVKVALGLGRQSSHALQLRFQFFVHSASMRPEPEGHNLGRTPELNGLHEFD